MKIPISERARRFGYIFWPKPLDEDVRRVLGDRASVLVVFEGRELGEKRIDWPRRRVSIGQKQTGALPATAANFDVTVGPQGALLVRVTT